VVASIRRGPSKGAVFNPLGTTELIAGMGRTMRDAARADGQLDGFARSQLLSGHSIARLLAAELASAEELLRWTRLGLLKELANAPARAAASDRIAAAEGAVDLGAALCDLLAELRRDGREPDLRRRLLSVLGEMAELELTGLGGETLRRKEV
jgi:hypothetical protein